MHSPRNFPAPAQYVSGMTKDQYAMQGGRDRVTANNSLALEESLFKSRYEKGQKSSTQTM